jgi:hypothetical protein
MEDIRGVSYEELDKTVTLNCQQIFLDCVKVVVVLYLISIPVWMFMIMLNASYFKIIGLMMLTPLGVGLLVLLGWCVYVLIRHVLWKHIKKNWYLETEGGTWKFKWMRALADIAIWFIVTVFCLFPIWGIMLENHRFPLGVRIIGLVFLALDVAILVGAFVVGLIYNIIRGIRKLRKHARKHWWIEREVTPRDTEIEMSETVSDV